MVIAAREQQIAELRQRMDQLTGRLGMSASLVASQPTAPHRSGRALPQLPGLRDVPALVSGAVHQVDNLAFALALAAGTSAEGGWLGVIGVPELGYEAAGQAGIELERTIVIPEPGEQWMSALAELSEVTDVVLVRPASGLSAGQAEKLRARFRLQETAVLSAARWPRCELSYHLIGSQWLGAGQGDGYLQQRRAKLEVTRPGWPVSRFTAWLPGHDHQITVHPEAASAPENRSRLRIAS